MRYILLLAYVSFTQSQTYSYVPSPSPFPFPFLAPLPMQQYKKQIYQKPISSPGSPSRASATSLPISNTNSPNTNDPYNVRAILIILVAIALWCMRFYIYRYLRNMILKLNKEQELYNIQTPHWIDHSKRNELYAIDVKRQDLWSLQATTYRRHGLNSSGSVSPV